MNKPSPSPLPSARLLVLLAVVSTLVAACGGDSLTSPSTVSASSSSSRVPQVAGSYSGTVTVSFPEVPRTVNCSATTAVTQTGSNVSIAPLQLRGGECDGLSFPFGNMVVDSNGSMGGDTGTVTSQGCTYTFSAGGGFFGRDMRASMTYVSRTCLNMTITINLTRA